MSKLSNKRNRKNVDSRDRFVRNEEGVPKGGASLKSLDAAKSTLALNALLISTPIIVLREIFGLYLTSDLLLLIGLAVTSTFFQYLANLNGVNVRISKQGDEGFSEAKVWKTLAVNSIVHLVLSCIIMGFLFDSVFNGVCATLSDQKDLIPNASRLKFKFCMSALAPSIIVYASNWISKV